MSPVPDDQMGDVWPAARPGPETADYGTVAFKPRGAFPVRSFQTFTIVYTVGEYGLDDTGAIKIVQRWTGDQGPVQFSDPTAANYVTATASNGVTLECHAEPYPHQRPWYNGLRVTVKRGYMAPGDTITIVFGDTSGGSPGYLLQTFCETAFEFRVLSDPCATGVFLPVGSPAISIVAGPPRTWTAVLPTLRPAGAQFSFGLRAEDLWGNITGDYSGTLYLEPSVPVHGLPRQIEYPTGRRGLKIDDLCVRGGDMLRITVRDGRGQVLTCSNPMVLSKSRQASWWGDLHGQSGETVGINTLHEYLEFGRDQAFLDVMSHQANDFQITNAFWAEINRLSAAFNEDGRFVVFPGYEWSGNTPVGGDHNVFFKDEGRPLRRSSHALLTDRSDIDSDAPTLRHLFAALKTEDCVLYAHVGGRPADISFAHDPALRTAVEVHSDWGTFEWIMTDAFRLGHRVGLVCNSDGHKGAPGACHPGASEFGAYSGLTCFLTGQLTRDAIFASMRRRHHYGTTGCRLHLDVTAHLGPDGTVFPEDPAISDAAAQPAETAIMGDIVTGAGRKLSLEVTCCAPSPVERIDIMNGPDIVRTWCPPIDDADGVRLRVLWEGAEYRGRGRQTHWTGTIRLSGPEITRFAKINAWNHERRFDQQDPQTIAFDAVTTGNFGGCDIWLDSAAGHIAIDTALVSGRINIADIGASDHILDAGGLDRRIRVFRLPAVMTRTDVTLSAQVPLIAGQDNPVWVRVTTEDGHRAWSSPIYHID